MMDRSSLSNSYSNSSERGSAYPELTLLNEILVNNIVLIRRPNLLSEYAGHLQKGTEIRPSIPYKDLECYQEAEALYLHVLSIDTKRFGPEHLEVAVDLESYADLLQKMDRSDEAMQLQKRAQTIRDKQ